MGKVTFSDIKKVPPSPFYFWKYKIRPCIWSSLYLVLILDNVHTSCILILRPLPVFSVLDLWAACLMSFLLQVVSNRPGLDHLPVLSPTIYLSYQRPSTCPITAMVTRCCRTGRFRGHLFFTNMWKMIFVNMYFSRIEMRPNLTV